MTEPRIEILKEKKLVGKRLKMSLTANKTAELWRSFMMEKKSVSNRTTTDMISMQVYDNSYDFKNFNPQAEFEKWAVVEVSEFDSIPEGMESYTLTGGMYAVFIHKGPASGGAKTFQYIFGIWIPNSEYELDHREHFELLGEKYKNNEPDSEEEIWIPIRKK